MQNHPYVAAALVSLRRTETERRLAEQWTGERSRRRRRIRRSR